MKIDFDRLNDMGVFLLPCPFEDDAYTVVDQEGRRRGKVKPVGGMWEASNHLGSHGKKEKIEEAVILLL